jgi:hypothetical protein
MSQAGELSISSQPGIVDFIEGNTGGPVPPNAGNIIFLLGQGNLSVSGNPATNTLTIADTGITAWNKISASQTLVVNNGYFCTGGGTLSLLLPATSAVGDTINVVLVGSTGWTITQGAGQQIKMGNQQTTAGVGGSLSSTQQGDSVTMVCLTTNLTWVVINSMGNPTVV